MKIILLVMAPAIVILGLMAIVVLADDQQRKEDGL